MSTLPPPQPSTGELASELQKLGQQMLDSLRLAWESDERKKVQQEVEVGLSDMVYALKKAADDFSQSPAGQNLKSEFEDFRQRLQSGEVEANMRREVLSALQKVNAELERVIEKQKEAGGAAQPPSARQGGCDDCDP